MKLDDIDISATGQSAIVYGPPKSGKTDLVVRGLAHQYKVLYIDFENGLSTLMKLPAELRKNVEVIRVPDNKDHPTAIHTALHLASGNKALLCIEHGKKDCIECKKAARNSSEDFFEEWNLNELDPKEWVVVFDSFTQLTSSANAHVSRNLDLEKDKLTFDHWRAQGVLLEKFLDYIQYSKFNSVVITHEMGIEQADKTEKLMPSGGTKNFARTVSKYFSHIVYVSVKNAKHNAVSSTTGSRNALAGSRLDAEVDMSHPETMCTLFGKPVAEKAATKPNSTGSSTTGMSLKQRLAKR